MNREWKTVAEKAIAWIGSSYEDLVAMPDDVKSDIGHALRLAQNGDKAPYAKPMHGGKLSNVMEIVVNDDNRTFRGVYTTKFGSILYVLDAFVKKSKRGSETPKHDEDRIWERYKRAKEHYEAQNKGKS